MSYPYTSQTQRPGYEQPSLWRRIGETFRSHPFVYAGIIGFLALRPARPLPYETELADAVAAVTTIKERQDACHHPGKWPIRYLGGPQYCTDMNSVSGNLPAGRSEPTADEGQQLDPGATNQSDPTVTSTTPKANPAESPLSAQPPRPDATTGAS